MEEQQKSEYDIPKVEELRVPVQIEGVKLIDNQKIRIEFRIDDIIKKLKIDIIDKIGPIAACGGCSNCSK